VKCPKCLYENPQDTRFCGQCASPLTGAAPGSGALPPDVTKTMQTPAAGIAAGSAFAGRYQILEELGEGGMGHVYLTMDRELEEKVALKVIKPKIASDEKTLQRFRNELKLARMINHKNVCRMYDLNKFGETQYITMEYVPGENLKSLMKRAGPLSIGKAISIGAQICAGLEEAHRLGVIHRDLKPQNIMIDREGNVRIMDFGIARALSAPGMTEDGQLIGTLEYMSPEQLEGKKADERADLYSVGVILYEMITGRLPFEGETPISIAAKHITAAPIEPRVLNSQISAAVSRTIMKCLEKDREKRYRTAAELLADFNALASELPQTQPLRPLKAGRTSKVAGRSAGARRYLLPAAVVMAAVCLLIWGVFLRRPGPAKSVIQQNPAASGQAPESAKEAPASPPGGTMTTMPVTTAPVPTSIVPMKSAPAAPPERAKADIGSLMNAGRVAFQRADYDACIQSMKDVLKVAPDDEAARRLLADATDRKRARLADQDIQTRLANAGKLLQAANYEGCLAEAKAVLAIDPNNAEAARYANEAGMKLAPEQVKALVQAYVRAFNDQTLPTFYKEHTTPELFQRVEKDVALIMAAYGSLKSAASNINVRVADGGQAETDFSMISTAERKSDKRRQVLFEGTYLWQMEKRGDRWLIAAITARPVEKK
jgi:predicted Ser/Thr protein kinase